MEKLTVAANEFPANDLVSENLRRLGTIFPDAFIEGRLTSKY